MVQLNIRYWGVRGSLPVPGSTTVRYGGNTSCVEVRNPKHRMIVDAGTGATILGGRITETEHISLILTHLHWDHIQGFPFFAPVYRKGGHIDIFSGHKADVSLESVLKGQMQEPNFPMSMEGLPANLTFNEVRDHQEFDVPGSKVGCCALHHPNGATGFSFETGGKKFVHLTDHEHTADYDEHVVTFCEGADILSMDTMYTPEQYPNHVGWGHSTWLQACEIARRSGAKKLILFHHNPIHSDDIMDQIGKLARAEFSNTIVAYEGLELEL